MHVWMRRGVALLVAGVAGVLGLTEVASAATSTVSSTTDTALPAPGTQTTCPDPCSLREAVQVADNNHGAASTISVPAGLYTLGGPSSTPDDPSTGDLDIINNASVTITGAGSGTTTINANGVDRAFAVKAGAGLTLSGVTIENGKPGSNSTASQVGGAIYSDGALAVTGDVTFAGNGSTSTTKGGAIYADNGTGSSLSLTAARFKNNVAQSGGAIYDALNSSSTALIADSTFADNGAPSTGNSGGALYGAGGNLDVTNSQFSANRADVGGGIYWNTQTRLSVTGSAFSGNSAGSGGGGLFDNQSTATTLSNDQFKANTSGSDGGAVYLDAFSNTAYTFDHDEFDGNSATGSGGAVDAAAGTLTATSTSLVDNSAANNGGALNVDTGGDPLTLVNVTASGNSAAAGGALYLAAFTPVTMTNDTITANTAASGAGGGVGLAGNATGTATATGIRNTVIAGNTGGDCTSYTFTSSVDSGHNLDGDSTCFGHSGGTGDKLGINPGLGAPANNGGAVLTDAEAQDSPTVDAGTKAGCPATDARDQARPPGAPCDMGAFQAPTLTLALAEAAPASVPAGSPYGYTLTITRGGFGASTNTTVSDQLPAGTIFSAASSSSGACTSSGAPALVTCALGTLADGATATVTINVSASQPGSLTNSATVTDDESATAGASAITQVTPAPAAVSTPTAVTTGVTGVTRTRATLLGRVTTGSQPTTYRFQYGTSKSYGQMTPAQTTSADRSVRATITRLTPGRRYHFRLLASNASGAAQGGDRTLVAGLPQPSVHLSAKHPVTRQAPYRYALTGTLRLPRGVTRARGCVGKVAITVRSGARRLVTRVVAINRRCGYSAGITVDRVPGQAASGKLSAIAVFRGNRALASSQSKRIGLRYG